MFKPLSKRFLTRGTFFVFVLIVIPAKAGISFFTRESFYLFSCIKKRLQNEKRSSSRCDRFYRYF